MNKNQQKNIILFNATLLKALSDEHRQMIILMLGKEGEMCVSEIASHFNISRPSISHHLKVLKEAKIVIFKKTGKEIYYNLNKRYIERSLYKILKLITSINSK